MCEFYLHIEIILNISKTKTLPKILPFLLFLVIGPVVTKKNITTLVYKPIKLQNIMLLVH